MCPDAQLLSLLSVVNLRLLAFLRHHDLLLGRGCGDVVALPFVHGELLVSDHLSCLHERLRLFQTILDVHQSFLAVLGCAHVERQLDLLRLLRFHVDVGLCSVGCLHTVLHDAPRERHVVERAEEVFVLHRHHAVGEVHGRGPDVLIVEACLIHVRVWHAVGRNQTVTVEVVV